jgi:hypothetical protein
MPRTFAELTGATVLLLIREKVATDLPTLCREFGFDPDSHESWYITSHLESLKKVGFIVENSDGTYMVSDIWRNVQNALGISLTNVTKLGPRSMIVKPYFGPPDRLANQPDVFIVMPFLDKLRPVWDDHIKPVAQRLGLTAARADDFFTAHAVMSDIWNGISGARAVIADRTDRNPNVFYEIGLAHAIGKIVIMITQSADDVPFDVRHLRYIRYEYTPRGMQEFEGKLAATLRAEIGLSGDG